LRRRDGPVCEQPLDVARRQEDLRAWASCARVAASIQGEIHRMKRLTTALEICALTVLTVSPVDGGAPLELVVTPVESFAPASVNIRARIQPNAHNRMITIVADGPEFYRSSQIQLDGEQGPKTVELVFSSLPGGEYEVFAVVTDTLGHHRATARQSTRVLPIFGGR